MRTKKYNLRTLRSSFDLEVNRAKLSPKSIARYQSWIKRYLRYCNNLGVEISNHSILSFLQGYETYSTRRQGFYALKFFSIRILKEKEFIRFKDTIKTKKRASKKFLRFLYFNND